MSASTRPQVAAKRYVYTFGAGEAEGDGTMRDLLGGKGAGLAEMTKAGLPVPPGFTITTEACNDYFAAGETLPEGLWEDVKAAVAQVEAETGKGFGDVENPLLVSVRSGAKFSMPGMMDTVLNLGLNEETLQGIIKLTGNERFGWDAYRRFIQLFGRIVLGVSGERMDEALDAVKERVGAKQDTDVDAEGMKAVVRGAQGASSRRDRQAVPAGSLPAARPGHQGRLRQLVRQARPRLPRQPEDRPRPGHRGQRHDHGLRQHGRGLRHRRGLHPQPQHRREHPLRRVPHQRPGRGRGGRHPDAVPDRPPGRADARGPRRVPGHRRPARAPLPRHAGHGVHHRARQALHAADPLGQAHRRGRGEDRRGHGRGRHHHQGGGPRPHRAGHGRPAAARPVRPRGAQGCDSHRQGPQRLARRGRRPCRLHRRRRGRVGRDAARRSSSCASRPAPTTSTAWPWPRAS